MKSNILKKHVITVIPPVTRQETWPTTAAAVADCAESEASPNEEVVGYLGFLEINRIQDIQDLGFSDMDMDSISDEQNLNPKSSS